MRGNLASAGFAGELAKHSNSAERAILDAFAPGVAPSRDEMRNEHCPECEDVVARFVGKQWSDVSVNDLRGLSSPGALTNVGFRYYLPAMMLRCLEATRELDCFPAGVVGQLSPAGGKLDARRADRLRFTRDQVKAILAFLRYLDAYQKIDASDPDWPEEAIQAVPSDEVVSRAIRFWSARLSEGAA